MKKFLLLCLVSSLVAASHAASLALVYENDEAVKAGQANPAPVTNDGIIVSAKWALANNATMKVGVPGDQLRKAVLSRLEAKSDVAIIQPGDVVADENLQNFFQDKARAYQNFAPSVSSGAIVPALSSVPVDTSTAPYKILLNGIETGKGPIELGTRFRKSQMDFEIVRLSTSPVWLVEFDLSSVPKLSFFKKGKNQTLGDVPTPKFHYGQQIFFKGLGAGGSIKVPVEAYFMEEGPYTLNVIVSSKGEKYETKIPVIFKKK